MATGKICRIKDCKNVLKIADGQVCQAHRSRFFRHGNYEISPNWSNLKKGTRCLTQNGYIRIYTGKERVLEHRLIMERHLGRRLTRHQRVHHKNHDRSDNQIENLELFENQSTHMKKSHKELWKLRKISPPYTPRDIANVLERLKEKKSSHRKCFCGITTDSRNLCSKHYQWAHKHNFIKSIIINT